jgi:hypothetical protein
MSPFVGSNILAGASGQGGTGYKINRSLRFNSGDSAYLSRTPSSAGNRKTWTWSGWVKRCADPSNHTALFTAGTTASNTGFFRITFHAAGHINVATGATNILYSGGKLRDFSSWYHVLVSVDTTASSNQVKCYVNGALYDQATAISNVETAINSTVGHQIGRDTYETTHADMYLADVHFIDGQALTPTDFGEYDDNNVWQPKEFTGNYGIVSVAAATGALPIYSTTDTYGTIKGTGTRTDSFSSSIVLALPMDGANNGTTFTDQHALIKGSGTAKTITVNGNTKTSTAQSIFYGSSAVFDGTDDNLKLPASADFQFGSGDFTIETWFRPNNTNRMAIYHGSSGTDHTVGIDYANQKIAIWASSNGSSWNLADGDSSSNRGSIVVPANSWSHIAFVRNGNSLQLYVNGVLDKQFSITGSIVDSSSYQPIIGEWWNNVYDLNGYLADFRIYKGAAKYTSNFTTVRDVNSFHLDFSDTSDLGADAAGSNDWTPNNLSGTAPGLSTANQGFDVVTYTGNGGTQSISSLAFQPDLVWIKARSATYNHYLVDQVRGFNGSNAKVLQSNLTNAEESQNGPGNAFVSFDNDGFTVALGTNNWAGTNQNNQTYVAWCWKAGGAAVSNTDGTITSQVSASTDYGFSIVTYQSNGTRGASIGHGLNTAPSWVVVKNRDGSYDWMVGHDGLGGWSNFIRLNTSGAKGSATSIFADTAPTSSVFYVGEDNTVNAGNSVQNYVAYCWSEVSGFSKFGSYSGTGSAVTVTTGFKPRYILVKSTSSGRDWLIWDAARGASGGALQSNTSNSAYSDSTYNGISFNSDGFTIMTGGSTPNMSASGETYIYAAFASKPDESVIDSLIDTPTDYEATPNNGGNYATLNPLFQTGTYSNGNLDLTTTAGNRHYRGTIGVSSGKWYWEFSPVSGATPGIIALVNDSAPATQNANQTGAYAYYSVTGYKQTSGVDASYGAGYTYGDVIGVAFDADNGTLVFYKNGVSQGTAFSGLTSGPYYPACSAGSSINTTNFVFNAGARPFAHTPPTGYKSLCTTNLPDPTIADGSTAFDTQIWTGNSSSRSITGYNLSPDLVWIKGRSHATNHVLYDIVRGPTKVLYADAAAAEATQSTQLTSFNSDGFSLGTGNEVNESSRTYVGWAWDAGDLVTTSDTTNYNQTQTWSSFGGSGIYSSTYDWTKLFDGDSTNRTIPANGSSITVDFSSLSGGGISYNSSVKVTFRRNGSGPDVTVNGSAIGATANYVETTYTLSGPGTLTSVGTLTRNAAGNGNTDLIKIVVDGKELIDPGVIPAGGLNSSLYDQSQTWSNGTQSGNSPWGSSSWNYVFNGVIPSTFDQSNLVYQVASGGVFTFSSAISGRIQVYSALGSSGYYSGNTIVLSDGTSQEVTNGNSSFVLYDFGVKSNITSITLNGAGTSSGLGVPGILLDGKLLVDAGVSITTPSIASTVRANPSTGCSICTWSGTGSAGTISHGLNAPLQMIWIKQRTNHGTTGQGDGNWIVGHEGLGMGSGRLILNGTFPNDVSGAAAHWNSTAATSSVFSVGTSGNVNGSNGAQYIAYCFAPVEGYSAFGKYTGNGSADGPFVYTGFRPRWVLLKSAGGAFAWHLFDTARDTYNLSDARLRPDSSGVEDTSNPIDIYSNGFKIKTNGNGLNQSNITVVYAAFAEHPFKTARAR